MTQETASEAPPASDASLHEEVEPVGRVGRARARAEAASQRYLALAERRPVLGLPLAFAARYTARQGVLLASALAFRLFLCLLPLALLLAGILAAFSREHGTTVKSAIQTIGIAGVASQQISSALSEGRRSWVFAVVVGALYLLWTVRTFGRSLTMVSAHAWAVGRARRNPREVVVATLLFAVALILLLVVGVVANRLATVGPGGAILGVLVDLAGCSAVWFAVSLRLPDRRHDWIDLVPGCVLFGLAIGVLHVLTRVYLPAKIDHSSHLYGSLGIAAAILAWMLLFGLIIVSCALANSVWSDYREQRRGVSSGVGGSEAAGGGPEHLDGQQQDDRDPDQQ